MVGSGAVTFAVWGYIISHQKPPAFDVEVNPKILSVIIGETEENIIHALDKFCQPDPKSRSKVEEGRKLFKLGEYLYHVVNGKEYDELRSNEERREYWRSQKREKRKEKAANPEAIKLLELLNAKSGRDFRKSESSLTPIIARLAESGVTFEGVVKMIDRQVSRWKGDAKMEEYLRPSTLFGKEKFNEYYAARELPVSKQNGPPQRVDRSIGTANEGTAHLYRGLGKVPPAAQSE
jgi:uncharacterized phage protein (TIGR02220 family)